jgi:glycerol-3-phosphate dehydrogenase (NAD(P)+)
VATVTILGAGDMGTAITTPPASNGHDVRLWGTHMDAEIVETLKQGGTHPLLGVPVRPGVRVFGPEEAREAVTGADVVLFAVTSVGIRPTAQRFAEFLPNVPVVMTVAKGFDPGPDGDSVLMLPEVIAEYTTAPIVGVGGPAKANEVARGTPTAIVFGGPLEAASFCAEIFQTPSYNVEVTEDLVGVEIAAAMKNAYAIALGVSDGLERATGVPHHNFRAALFPRAVAEMGKLAEAVGGCAATVAGRPGSGDLQVTITSGRNRLLGERIGAGEPGPEAAAALRDAGITVEGYDALGFGYKLARSLPDPDTGAPLHLPLLEALYRVLHEGAPAKETIWAAV